MTSPIELQLGKKGLTNELLEEIEKRFEKPNVKNIKISVLQSARENREDVKKYSEEILLRLGKKYTSRVIGFSICIKKWRKEKI
ncbi:MAG: YhbY family RNA-binding protein [Candidatus Pacearchaeota archaeon]|jgi:RNA-binding protein YhbY